MQMDKKIQEIEEREAAFLFNSGADASKEITVEEALEILTLNEERLFMKMRDVRVEVAKGLKDPQQFQKTVYAERMYGRLEILLEKGVDEQALDNAMETHQVDQTAEYKELMQKYVQKMRQYVQEKMKQEGAVKENDQENKENQT